MTKQTETEIQEALAKLAQVQDLLDSTMTRLENRIYDDKTVDSAVFGVVEDHGWSARNRVDDLAATLRHILATF